MTTPILHAPGSDNFVHTIGTQYLGHFICMSYSDRIAQGSCQMWFQRNISYQCNRQIIDQILQWNTNRILLITLIVRPVEHTPSNFARWFDKDDLLNNDRCFVFMTEITTARNKKSSGDLTVSAVIQIDPHVLIHRSYAIH